MPAGTAATSDFSPTQPTDPRSSRGSTARKPAYAIRAERRDPVQPALPVNTVAEVNAGKTLLAALGAGYAYRLIDAYAVAVGGAAADP
jgi:hypothetical protein